MAQINTLLVSLAVRIKKVSANSTPAHQVAEPSVRVASMTNSVSFEAI